MIDQATSRRSFLKAGAIVAAPVAALAAPAAFAADPSAAQLARMEDERAIEGLVRGFLRRFNGSGDCAEFVAHAGAIRIDTSVQAIREDARDDAALNFADDGRSASYRRKAEVDLLADFAGNSTLEKMARFQGQGSAVSLAKRRIEAEFVRTGESWTITRLALA
jgi:hypothetical protein